MGMTLTISRCVAEAIQRAAAAAAPREACGLLFGAGDQVTEYQVVENVSKNPETRFEIDPAVLFAALRAERAGGAAILGYWHSHPSGDAHPSVTDLAMAAADGKVWLIAAGTRLTAWRAGDGGLEPLCLQIGGD